MLKESRQQKSQVTLWEKKNTKERAPTAKSLVQICTSASLSAEWKHTNWHRAGSKTTKLNVEFHPTVYVCILNDWMSNTSSLNKFSRPMRCQTEQLPFWLYFCIFFSGSTAFLECPFSLIFTFTLSFLRCQHWHWFFYSSFFFSLTGVFNFSLVNTICTSLFILFLLFLLQLFFVLKKQSLSA